MIHLTSTEMNMSLSTQNWVPINVKRTTVAYATQFAVSEGVIEIMHDNSSALMAVNIYGFASGESYGYSGRLSYIHATGNVSSVYIN